MYVYFSITIEVLYGFIMLHWLLHWLLPCFIISFTASSCSEAKDLEPHAIRQAIERAVVESPGWVLSLGLWGSA